ncbi:MAG TPA: cyclic nucleotide-binding domain-containing protein [Clostridiales bacterium]|nr:cyclic nucleotide-binding domain-containing protein [Clostridiales bacterium]HQP69865.1 cyclic nucleotide-binding domain-containing protein [Clostridiales bacterium]
MSTAAYIAMMAGIWGLVSAVSLPVGAVIGLWAKPTQKVTSSLMAFGGGALLFALTIELFAHSLHLSHEGHDNLIIISTMGGAIMGGLIFEMLNRILNSKGAFLRKASLFKRHIQLKKNKSAKKMIKSLSTIKFLHLMPPEEISQLMQVIKTRSYKKGDLIITQGNDGQELFFIIEGNVDVIRDTGNGPTVVAKMGAGDTFGEIALISDCTRTADVRATSSSVQVYVLEKSDYQNMLKYSLALQDASAEIITERLQDMSEKDESFKAESLKWQIKAQKNLNRLSLPVTKKDLEDEVKEHGGAALAIWLGIALDGIPESLVIGMLTVAAASENKAMSLAFIAGVFLANLPEAMSSAVTMQRQGSGFKKIFWMWMSLCIMTGVGALISAVVFPCNPEGYLRYFISGIEGMAAGAMLTMIANTMLPEAYEHGGSTIAGLSTLIGFLAALCVKVIG